MITSGRRCSPGSSSTNTILLLSIIPFPMEETLTTTTRMELRKDSTDLRSRSIIMLTTKTITTSSLLHPAHLMLSLHSVSQLHNNNSNSNNSSSSNITNKLRLHNQPGPSFQGNSTFTGLQTVSSISSLPTEDSTTLAPISRN
jgi:hypothetical protein